MNIYIAVAIPVIIAFVISVALGPVIIPFLRKLKFGQTVRDDGPQSHLKKNGTPTMGGIIFLISVILTSCIYLKDYPQIIPVLFVTVGFGVIGFLDDYIKIVLKRSEGLTPSQKMFGQIIVTGVFAVYMYKFSGISMEMIVPFFPNVTLDLGFLTIPVMFLAIIGTVNGVNFTDGLDGLATSVTIMVAVFFGSSFQMTRRMSGNSISRSEMPRMMVTDDCEPEFPPVPMSMGINALKHKSALSFDSKWARMMPVKVEESINMRSHITRDLQMSQTEFLRYGRPDGVIAAIFPMSSVVSSSKTSSASSTVMMPTRRDSVSTTGRAMKSYRLNA